LPEEKGTQVIVVVSLCQRHYSNVQREARVHAVMRLVIMNSCFVPITIAFFIFSVMLTTERTHQWKSSRSVNNDKSKIKQALIPPPLFLRIRKSVGELLIQLINKNSSNYL